VPGIKEQWGGEIPFFFTVLEKCWEIPPSPLFLRDVFWDTLGSTTDGSPPAPSYFSAPLL